MADARFPGGQNIVQWAVDFLKGIGAPINPITVGAAVTWANHESGGYRPGVPGGENNPLNTTEGALGFSGQGGSQGNIKDFGTYQQGVNAQVYNLTHTKGAGYEQIIAAFRQGTDAQAIFRAIDQSRFGTHGLEGSSPASVPSSLPSPSVGDATHNAILTSAGASTLCFPGPFNICVPNPLGIAAGAFNAASAAQGLAGDLLLMFSNWRYVVEFFVGVGMVLLGIRLIYADISGGRVLPDVKQRTQQAAMVAAVAAA